MSDEVQIAVAIGEKCLCIIPEPPQLMPAAQLNLACGL